MNYQENQSTIFCNILDTCIRDHSCIFTVFTDSVNDERSLFKIADYYITTRAKENVQRTCFAELYNAKCISGVDIPVGLVVLWMILNTCPGARNDIKSF